MFYPAIRLMERMRKMTTQRYKFVDVTLTDLIRWLNTHGRWSLPISLHGLSPRYLGGMGKDVLKYDISLSLTGRERRSLTNSRTSRARSKRAATSPGGTKPA